MGLDQEVKDFRSEVVADFEQGCGDSVASPHHHGDVRIPVQLLVEDYTQHLDSGRRRDS